MSNTSKGEAKKGSKKWMQKAVKEAAIREKLEAAINGGRLIWLSPLKSDEFAEYTLNSKKIYKDNLRISEKDKKRLFEFWPSRQPQWDAIALNESKDTLYLFEAKAHKVELNSKCSSNNVDNLNKIKAAFKTVKEHYNFNDTDNIWMKKYYQLANRLTFLHKLSKDACEKSFGTLTSVKLILLNFANDPDFSTSEADWKDHYEKVWKAMIGREDAPEGVKVIYFDVGEYCKN